MLAVISNPTPIANEARLINALFGEGMEVFHLRKPGASINELRVLLDKIKQCYHPQIALHQHHSLAEDYSLKRRHFTEAKREHMSEEELLQLKKSDFILSTSIHKIQEYKKLSSCFSYTFFGPVFSSISKEGYISTLPNEFVFPVEKNHLKVIALGGINAGNIGEAIKMRFDGVAVLGTIWLKTNESIQQFKAVKKAWKQTGK
ncbi:thiamine phosphate synthase [Segetibacter koreensis]|uniref:thiamine phosphate synthase n=1 Tax=Segetibacter koreensis TaxID=398037 RepID=UPI00036B3B57|nr:thiamine phosphate synthase [Segetibacter koreensis]